MKPTLQFRLSQHLTLTRQLQQSIRLLQLSTVELNQEIERLLMDNPILEREDGESEAAAAVAESSARAPAGEAREHAEEPHPDFSAPSWRGNDDDGDDGERSRTAPDTPTLRDHLYGELALLSLEARDRTLVGLLIDALDEDGYLTQPLEEIAALMPPEAEVSVEELAIALRHLQNFEPAGVGARNPGECLALQIRALKEEDPGHVPFAELALRIAERHLELARVRFSAGSAARKRRRGS